MLGVRRGLASCGVIEAVEASGYVRRFLYCPHAEAGGNIANLTAKPFAQPKRSKVSTESSSSSTQCARQGEV